MIQINFPCLYQLIIQLYKLQHAYRNCIDLGATNSSTEQIIVAVSSANICEQKVNEDYLKCQLCLVYPQTHNTRSQQHAGQFRPHLPPCMALLCALVASHFCEKQKKNNKQRTATVFFADPYRVKKVRRTANETLR